MLQQGATGIDLVRTSQIDVVVDLGQRRFARIYDFAMDDKKQPALTSYPQLQAELVCNLDVAVSGSYRIRSVVSGAGDDTSVEGDDKVRYTTRKFGGPNNRFTLLDSEEIGYSSFVVLTEKSWPLQVLQPNLADRPANYEPLLFGSVDEAIDFRRWFVGQVRANGVAPEASGCRFKIRKSDIEQIPATPDLAARFRIVPEQRAKCQSS